jgi:hypothetical protein
MKKGPFYRIKTPGARREKLKNVNAHNALLTRLSGA